MRELLIGLLVLSNAAVAAGQWQPPLAAQAGGTVASRLEITVPTDNAELTIDGRGIAGTGRTRTFTASLKDGATAVYDLEVSWRPNGYTVMYRKASVTLTAGKTLAVDLTAATPADRGEVVFVPTPPEIVVEMLNLAEVGPGDVVFDLGCGDGRMVITAARLCGARGVGIDIKPELVQTATEAAKQAGVADRVEFRSGDVFDDEVTAGLADATVVMLYMGEELNVLLRPKLIKTLRPGAKIVSHQFPMGDWKPDKTERVETVDGSTYPVYLWIVKEADQK